jgi:succinoglycan biosynthesis transport protein ExoP
MAFESQAVRDARIDIGAVLDAVVRHLPRIVVLTALLLVATFVILMFMPRLYESSAAILVEPRSNVYVRAANEQAPTLAGGEAGAVSSQIELIKSRDTLLMVIDKLDLRSVAEFNGAGGGFSPMALVGQLLGRSATAASVDEIVLGKLYDRLSVVQERDSRIISVLVRSTDPQRAAEIANAVANAHVTRRAELSLSDTAEASGWLNDEIAKLRVTVTAAETAVADFKVDNDLFIGANNTSLADQQLTTIASQINAAQERKNTALSRATLIRGMIEQDQPIDGVPDVRDSVVIQQLSQEKGRLQGEKAQRSATLLANHPAIQALTAQIAELNNQINIEGRRVAAALEAEARIEADLEASLQADLARAKSSASTATQDTVALDALQRDAKAQRDLLEGYLQRYSEAISRTDANSALPDVRVVSVAAPSVTPASPKTALILLAVGIVALTGQFGLIVFAELMSGRAIIPGDPVIRPQDELEELPFVADEGEPGDLPNEPDFTPSPQVGPEPEPTVAAVEPEIPHKRQRPELQRFLQAFARIQAPPAIEAAIDDAVAATAPSAPLSEAPAIRPTPPLTRLSELTDDLILGRTHLVILAGHRSNAACVALAEELIRDALGRGLSAALVDAGSGRASDDPGLTDLSADAASFGDVVHKAADNSFAEVPWGQGETIARSSTKPLTLVEALADLYEVVVLMTGRVGTSSSLPLFDGLQGRLVLVTAEGDDPVAVAETRERLLDAGFRDCEIAAAPARIAA